MHGGWAGWRVRRVPVFVDRDLQYLLGAWTVWSDYAYRRKALSERYHNIASKRLAYLNLTFPVST